MFKPGDRVQNKNCFDKNKRVPGSYGEKITKTGTLMRKWPGPFWNVKLDDGRMTMWVEKNIELIN